jgi:hypothetical protein
MSRCFAVIACLAVPLTGRAAWPQEPLPATGAELFRSMFGFYGFEPVTDPDALRSDELSKVTVVVIGRLPEGRQAWSFADLSRRVLQAGGALLLVTDQPGPVGRYLPGLPDVAVLDGYAFNSDSAYCYRRQSDHPLLKTAPDPLSLLRQADILPAPERSLFEPRDRLVSARPSAFQVSDRPFWLADLAKFPPLTRFRLADGTSFLADPLPVAVGGTGPKKNPFRCLLVADPDVFGNRLLVGQDGTGGATNNLEFAARVIRYLKPADTDRPKCVFVEGGVVQSDLATIPLHTLADTPLPPVPSPLDPAVQARMADVINRTIDDAQTKDRANAALTKANRDGSERFPRLMLFLLVAAALAAAGWFVRRAWGARHAPDLPALPAGPVRTAAAGEPGSLAHRREELILAGDYAGPVSEFLNDLFVRQGLPADEYRHPRKPPAVAVAGADARAIRNNLHILWGVAYGSERVSYSRWKELEPMIAAVKRAADDGRWRFAAGEGA